jgi:hypothetical protein
MTEYVVLERNTTEPDGPERWLYAGTGSARSAAVAIKEFLATGVHGSPPLSGGVYVAVPARSWKPVTVKVETKTALRFS